MSDDFRFQASVKVPHGPDNYRDSMINVRGNSAAEFAADLTWLEQNAATVAAALQAIHASVNVQAGFPGSTNVQPAAVQENHPQAPAPQQSWSNQGSGASAPAPAAQYAPGQQSAPQQQAGPVPYCAHGPMQRKTGTSAKGPWGAYFCPTKKDDPTKCEPIWDKKG